MMKKEKAVIELTEQQRRELDAPEPTANEIMAEDDAGDPLLDSYQHDGKQA